MLASLCLIGVDVNVYNPHILHNLLKVNRNDRKQRVIRSRISYIRSRISKKENGKRTKGQTIIYKTQLRMIEQQESHKKNRGEIGYSGRVIRSCSTSGIHRVTLVTNPVKRHVRELDYDYGMIGFYSIDAYGCRHGRTTIYVNQLIVSSSTLSNSTKFSLVNYIGMHK